MKKKETKHGFRPRLRLIMNDSEENPRISIFYKFTRKDGLTVEFLCHVPCIHNKHIRLLFTEEPDSGVTLVWRKNKIPTPSL